MSAVYDEDQLFDKSEEIKVDININSKSIDFDKYKKTRVEGRNSEGKSSSKLSENLKRDSLMEMD